jgi:hypothetical protein
MRDRADTLIFRNDLLELGVSRNEIQELSEGVDLIVRPLRKEKELSAYVLQPWCTAEEAHALFLQERQMGGEPLLF